MRYVLRHHRRSRRRRRRSKARRFNLRVCEVAALSRDSFSLSSWLSYTLQGCDKERIKQTR